jgi:hypothetical protein
MDINRWNKFSLPQKLGNIGSEVARARLCEEKKDETGCKAALERVLEMLDATIDAQARITQKKELARARELVNCWYKKQNIWSYSPSQLEDYFTQFAYLI